VPARLIGDLEAEQRDGSGPWERNDRLLAVAQASRIHAGVRTIADVDRLLLEAIGAFFVDYHRLDGDEFRVTARAGTREALRAVRRAHRRYLDQGDRATATARSA
jgi:inorganic pyrophosphatase